MVKSLLFRSGAYFSGLLFVKVFSTILFLLFARVLEPDQFGSLSLFVTLLSIFTLIGDWGLIQYYQVEQAQKYLPSLNIEVGQARLFTSCVTVAVFIFYSYFTTAFSLLTSVLFVLMILPEGFSSVVDGYYLIKKQNQRIALKQLSKYIIPLFCMVLFPHLSLEVIFFAFMLSSVLTFIWYVPRSFYPTFTFSMKETTSLLAKSSDYATLILTSSVYSKGDALIVEFILGKFALGIYSASYRYLDSLSLFPNALSQSLFHLTAKDGSITIRQLSAISLIMTSLGVSVGGLLYFFSGFLTTTLLGGAYAQSQPILHIFSIVIVLIFINAPLSAYVQSSSLLKSFLPWAMLNTVVNILFNVFFIPIWGVSAAAWGMVFTETTGMIINIYFSRKRSLLS